MSFQWSPAHSYILKFKEFLRTLFSIRYTNVLFLIVIEVAGVPWSSALWYDRGFHLRNVQVSN